MKRKTVDELLTNEKIMEKKDYERLIFKEIYDATVSVFKTMTGISLEREKVTARDHNYVSGDISAVIEMVGAPLSAKMALAFDKKVFLDVVGKMIGDEIKEITPDFHDAAAELCNQIYGVAKARLVDMGCPFQMAIPRVITGDDHKIQHDDSDYCVVTTFKNLKGLKLEMSVDKTHQAKKAS